MGCEGLARCTDVLLQAFNNMQVRGVEADVVTCCSLISALERGGQWQLAGQLQWRATQVCPSRATLHLPAERCLCVWDKLLPTVSPALSIHSLAETQCASTGWLALWSWGITSTQPAAMGVGPQTLLLCRILLTTPMRGSLQHSSSIKTWHLQGPVLRCHSWGFLC